jgi:glutamate:GABA antiporter
LAGQPALKRELGLRDLVLAQIVCVVGSSWVGVAAKLGAAHSAFWLAAISMFYLPLAAVVIYLNREMPVEGGPYEWARLGFNNFLGYLMAWNLWIYAIVCVAGVLFMIPTDVAYFIGPSAAWIPQSPTATAAIGIAVLIFVLTIAVFGLGIAKWLHGSGGVLAVSAYAILIFLPLYAVYKGSGIHYVAIPWKTPPVSWWSLAVFGQMTIGALSGFEYVGILAGESRDPVRTIGRSVMISAPIIILMFILGTSTVLAFVGDKPIDLIGPIPQTLRLALGPDSWAAPLSIFMIATRTVAAGSLLITGLTRLPMTAGWDHLAPQWFTKLHPRWGTPVNSILVVGVVIALLMALSMLGVHEQEAYQLLANASTVHYGVAYVLLFALPLFGQRELRQRLPRWLAPVAAAGLLASAIAVLIAVYPIVDVVSRSAYALKIGGLVLLTNAAAVWIYRRSAISPTPSLPPANSPLQY